MGWRDWSYTKRGAIVGGVIGVLLMTLHLLNLKLLGSIQLIYVLKTIFYPILISLIKIIPIGSNITREGLFGYMIIFFVSIFVGSIIYGTIVGYILGKIKSRGQTSNPKQ